jgi:uncharacterized protein
MPSSISQYVLKVHSRCDLSCDHCYVYQHADQTWQNKPVALNERTARQAGRRIADHAAVHELSEVHIVVHGGEPLLLRRDGLEKVFNALRSLIFPVTRLDLRIQTNGVLLDEDLCDLFAAYDVKVGVSFDGDRTANDRHRRFSDGRSSYDQARRALRLLRQPEYQHLYAGILCTIDVGNDPIVVYEALLAERPPRLDLLLPHATWDQPPPRPAQAYAPYAAWLGQIHQRWIADGCPVPIRLFDSLVSAWQGKPSGNESVGLDPVDLLVIETDGSWEQADSLKTAFDGAPATGLNVFAHSVDQAAQHPGIAVRQRGSDALCERCRACPVVRACGGGLYAHRYRSGNGFDNPSVYCEDLQVLIPRVVAARETSGHMLSRDAFETLAAGPGNASAIEALLESQWSVARGQMAKVASELDSMRGDLGHAAREGWACLSDLDVSKPAAVREIFTYPFVRRWAMRCLNPADPAGLDRDRAHIAGLAAAAVLRAGLEAELLVPVRAGSVWLPAFGQLDVGTTTGPTVAIRVSPHGISTRNGARGWQTVRHVSVGDMRFTVDDIDPFRDCYEWPVTSRLPPPAWRTWCDALTAAGEELTSQLPAYSAAMAACLRSVVPLDPHRAGWSRSGTARQAFGALALALPPDAEMVGELLLHEVQHIKLAALCELFPLWDDPGGLRLTVPWRPDPRPAEGVLHGTYAYLSIADLWRSRARSQPESAQARQRFRRYRSWVLAAAQSLSGTGVLTPYGQWFVNGMQATAGAWADEP